MKMRFRLMAAAVAAALLSHPDNARAHRLDEYLQAARFSVRTDRVDLELDLTPGIVVAPQVSSLIDTNHDGRISATEGREYGARVLGAIELYLDNALVPLTLTDAVFPELRDMNAGTGMIRLRAGGAVAPAVLGRHELFYRNTHEAGISVYLANALVPEDKQIEITGQRRDAGQHELTIEYRVIPPPARSQAWLALAFAVAALIPTLYKVLSNST